MTKTFYILTLVENPQISLGAVFTSRRQAQDALAKRDDAQRFFIDTITA